MRQHLLAATERKIILEYLKTGKKLDGFRVVLHRCRKTNMKPINEDLELIRKFLEKAS
jgi:hypothetical protein